RHIPPPIKELVIKMHNQGLTRSDIRELTGVAERTQRRFTSLYHRTGEVAVTALLCGRRRTLNGVDCSFLEALIERTPDINFTELQHDLFLLCNVTVSLSTISRTLRRLGYTRKKVQ
ncbi:hypothetical protein OF83DRAFT_1044054, partial [Amylostereum chailletii]